MKGSSVSYIYNIATAVFTSDTTVVPGRKLSGRCYLLMPDIAKSNADNTLILCTFFLCPTFSPRVGGQGVGWTALPPPRRNPRAAVDGARHG